MTCCLSGCIVALAKCCADTTTSTDSWWCREVYRATSTEQQQRFYIELVQALKAAQSPLDALAILEVMFCILVQAVPPITRDTHSLLQSSPHGNRLLHVSHVQCEGHPPEILWTNKIGMNSLMSACIATEQPTLCVISNKVRQQH